MAFGTGFGALVNGFIDGGNIRHQWDDRKDGKKRQAVLDGYEAERQKRLGDLHGWDAETHDWNRDRFGWEGDRHGVYMGQEADADRLRDQAWADDSAMREAYAAAAEAASTGMMPRGLPEAYAPPPAPGPVEQAANAGSGLIPQPGPSGRPYGITPGVATGAAGQYPRGFSGAQPNGPAADPRGYSPQPGADQVHVGVEQRDYPFSPSYSDPGAIRTLGTPGEGRMLPSERPGASRATAAPPEEARGIAEILERRESGLPDIGHNGKFGEDMAELAKLPARGAVRAADFAANAGARGVRQVLAPVNAMAEWVTGEKLVEPPKNVDSLDTGRPRANGTPDVPAAAPKPPTTPEGKPMDQTQTEAATAATAVLSEVVETTPGMAEAAEAVTRGLRPGARLTTRQRATGAQTFMQSYRDNGAPMVIKEMMRQGQFAQAETLRTFVDSAATTEGMDAWAGAVFAAQQGDVETAVDGIITAYNSNGYYNDGFEIDRERTELIRADDGEVMGIKMVVRDQATGEEIVTEESIPGLLEKGLWIMSPQKAAENFMTRQEAQRAQLIELDAARREAEGEIVTEDHKSAQTAARTAYAKLGDPMTAPRDAEGNPLPTPSWPEFLEQFMGGSGVEPALGGADVPVMRR